MICPYCKNVLQDAVGVVICPYCGGQVCMQQPQQFQQVQYQQPPQFQQPQFQQPQFQQPQFQQPQFQQPHFQQPPQFRHSPCPGGGYNGAEQVNMFTALKKYAQFSGRARRSEYWLWVLFNVLIWGGGLLLFIMLADGGLDGVSIGLLGTIAAIYGIAMIIPNWAVSVRRLHDVGKSGIWVLLPIIPVVGWIFSIILLVYFCSDSEYGPNQYGPNPKGLGNRRY